MFIDPRKKAEYIEGMLIVFDRKKQEDKLNQQLSPTKPVVISHINASSLTVK